MPQNALLCIAAVLVALTAAKSWLDGWERTAMLVVVFSSAGLAFWKAVYGLAERERRINQIPALEKQLSDQTKQIEQLQREVRQLRHAEHLVDDEPCSRQHRD